MTDRELLELAAKAAGIVGLWHERGQCIHVTNCAGMSDVWWRPLEDDGDALRLAVKLNIGIRSHGADHWHNPSSSVALYEVGDHGGRVTVEHGDDPSFSTRRAIVRAAAAIGKAHHDR